MTSLSDAFCYWPNGTLAQNTTSGEYALPCDTGAGVSSCCLPGQQCNTQFRCQDVAGNFVQASCTQKDFNNYNCPCPNQIVGLDPTTGCPDGTDCCGVRNSSCCAKGQGRLSIIYNIDGPLPTATLDIASYLSGYAPSTATINTASQASSTSNGPTVVTLTAMAAASTAASTMAPADSKSDSSSGLSSGAKAGIGIGIALVVIAIAILGWFIMRKRRKSNVRGLGTQGQRLDGDDYGGGTWFRSEVEGDTHHSHQKAIEMERQNGNLRVVVPSSTHGQSPVPSGKTELDAFSPYGDSPRESELEQPERRFNEMEQPSARPSELEQHSQPRLYQADRSWNELEQPQRRHELE